MRLEDSSSFEPIEIKGEVVANIFYNATWFLNTKILAVEFIALWSNAFPSSLQNIDPIWKLFRNLIISQQRFRYQFSDI